MTKLWTNLTLLAALSTVCAASSNVEYLETRGSLRKITPAHPQVQVSSGLNARDSSQCPLSDETPCGNDSCCPSGEDCVSGGCCLKGNIKCANSDYCYDAATEFCCTDSGGGSCPKGSTCISDQKCSSGGSDGHVFPRSNNFASLAAAVAVMGAML